MQLELFQRNGVKKLENKIHIYELDCYKNATEEQKKRMRVRKDRYFDLEGLPSEEVRKLLEDFVWERGKKLAPSSLASEILYVNNETTVVFWTLWGFLIYFIYKNKESGEVNGISEEN